MFAADTEDADEHAAKSLAVLLIVKGVVRLGTWAGKLPGLPKIQLPRVLCVLLNRSRRCDDFPWRCADALGELHGGCLVVRVERAQLLAKQMQLVLDEQCGCGVVKRPVFHRRRAAGGRTFSCRYLACRTTQPVGSLKGRSVLTTDCV